VGQVADFASLLRRSGNGYEGREVALATTAERVIGSAILGSIEMPKVPKMR
jgi:hypothetical protein